MIKVSTTSALEYLIDQSEKKSSLIGQLNGSKFVASYWLYSKLTIREMTVSLKSRTCKYYIHICISVSRLYFLIWDNFHPFLICNTPSAHIATLISKAFIVYIVICRCLWLTTFYFIKRTPQITIAQTIIKRKL